MFVIAGVTGHVGSVVAEKLLASGQKVRVLVRNAEKGAAWSQKGAEVAVGALDDTAFLTRALEGASAFFTLLPPDLSAPDVYAYQRRIADAITGAVKASGVAHVVLLSSVGADLAEGTGPIKGLHYLENALRATSVKLTAIRAGYFQENIGNSLAPAKHLGIFPNFTPSADYPTPMIATKDIGALAAESLLSPAARSEIIDLQGPAYSIRQLAEKLGAALGKKLEVVDIPEAGWIDAMTQGGLSKHAAEVFAEMYKGFGSGAIRPKGDRLVQGKTTIDEVIKTLV
ncbi:putative nucleoside-diphosphate-sugar epimerase [Minicystis rosea]|nr:putative nucleoside-diphosphate-sugar epimerase [Minicystis rosea]